MYVGNLATSLKAILFTNIAERYVRFLNFVTFDGAGMLAAVAGVGCAPEGCFGCSKAREILSKRNSN